VSVVLVTGSSSGFGELTALAFARKGATVYASMRNCTGASRLVAQAKSEELQIQPIALDVTKPQSIEAAVKSILLESGRIDVLVNNAGIAGPGGRLEEIDPADVTRTLDVNVTSMFRTARHAIPMMTAQGSGLIVNIASTAGYLGFPYRSPYAASKWAVIGLTKTMAMELGELGVRVNAICPGSIAGPRMDHVIELEAEASGRTPDDIRRGFEQQTSMRTFIEPGEIADTIAYLASPLGHKVSGQALSVDGHTETLRTW